MPNGGFKCVEPTLNVLYMLTDFEYVCNKIRMFEIDIVYPNHLHNEHNDLPLLPVNSKPQNLHSEAHGHIGT